MYDVNDHPEQDKVNEELGEIIGVTVNSLQKLSDDYHIDPKSLVDSFNNVFNTLATKNLLNKNVDIEHELMKQIIDKHAEEIDDHKKKMRIWLLFMLACTLGAILGHYLGTIIQF